MTPLIKALLDAVPESMAAMRARFSNIKWGDASINGIEFAFDGIPHTGVLIGRNADLMLTGKPEQDASLCLRVLLDGDAKATGESQ